MSLESSHDQSPNSANGPTPDSSSLSFSIRTGMTADKAAVRRKGASQTKEQKSRALEKFRMAPIQVQIPVLSLSTCVTLGNLSDFSELQLSDGICGSREGGV